MTAPVDEAGQAPSEREAPRGVVRRPYLDGLRAVAVYLVLLMHSHAERFVGGFIGVDVFFVLSGYLVTQVLTRDISGLGSVRLSRFYARRVRRLLPAAAAMLLISALVLSMLYNAFFAAVNVENFQAAFLYVANWHQLRQSEFVLALGFSSNPTAHFWSLAIEEQFYLVWPLILGGLFAVTRRAARPLAIIRAVVAVAALASLTVALLIPRVDAYRRTDARAYELLAGAFLALTPSLIARLSKSRQVANVLAVLAICALGFVATSVWHADFLARAMATTVITFVLIAALEAAPTGLIARILSLEPIVYLGLISYGTYLWQWPVMIFIEQVAVPNWWQLAGLGFLIATGLASLSYQILERPIRSSRTLDRFPKATIFTGLAVSVFCALVIIPAILEP